VHFDFTTPEGLKTNASDQKKKKKKNRERRARKGLLESGGMKKG